MDENERQERIKVVTRYLYTILGGGAAAVYLMYYQGLFVGGLDTATVMMMLSDAFFLPGAAILGVGLLVWVAGEGMFDMMAYGVKMLWDVAYKHEWETYHDYRVRKGKKEKMNAGFLIFVGLAFVLLAAVFTGLFYLFL